MTALERIFGDSQGHNATVTWQPNPQGRGTLSILWTCLLTMSLCVWTALHLNIPPPERKWRTKLRRTVHMFQAIGYRFRCGLGYCIDSTQVIEATRTVRTFLRKVLWLLLGMFAPEVVVYAAALQFMETRTLTDLEISATQKFFVTMGGVAIDPREWEQTYLPPPDNDSPKYLSPRLIVVANRYDSRLKMQFSDRTIQDKSKTSTLAQAVVCTQALWFMAQCISRFAQPLPITLLELNTFAHCLCALVVYILWWHKPLDVAEPITLRGKSAHQLLAFLWTIECDHEYRKGRIVFRSDGASEEHASQTASQNDFSRSSWNNIILKPGEQLLNTGIYHKDQKLGDILVDQTSFVRWTLAAPVFRRLYGADQMPQHRALLLTQPASDLTLCPTHEDLTGDSLVVPILIVSGIVYGGLHALAWNAPFRNPLEQLLWRISSVIVMFYGPLYYLLNTLVSGEGLTIYRRNGSFFASWTSLSLAMGYLFTKPRYVVSVFWSGKFAYIIRFFLETCINLAFLFGRIYLVWESFWSLFHAVPGVFMTPRWSDFFPHIS